MSEETQESNEAMGNVVPLWDTVQGRVFIPPKLKLDAEMPLAFQHEAEEQLLKLRYESLEELLAWTQVR